MPDSLDIVISSHAGDDFGVFIKGEVVYFFASFSLNILSIERIVYIGASVVVKISFKLSYDFL